MPSGFEVAHQDQLRGTLTCVDRLIVHGNLSRLWFSNHMAYFLNGLGVHIAREFGQFVKQASSKVIARAEALAKKAGRPFIYQDRVVHGKDDLARQIAEIFESATDPRYTFRLALRPAPSSPGETGGAPTEEIVWITEESGREVVFRDEPYASAWKKLSVGIQSLFAPEWLL